MIRHSLGARLALPILGTLLVVHLVEPISAQTIELRPVNNGISRPADAPVIAGAVIVGNQISLAEGGINVELEILTSGWGNLPGNPALVSALATLDAAGYLGANASPAQPGVNLNPLGWPGTPSQGAFQVTEACSVSGRDCGNGQAPCTMAEGSCAPTPRFVLNCCAATNNVDTTSIDYRYSATATSGGAADPGAGPNPSTYGYLGTVLLQVPGPAATTYTVSFVNDGAQTNLCPADCTGIPSPNLIPATVKLITGGCCTNMGLSSATCTDNLTEAQCNSIPTVTARRFVPGEMCASGHVCCTCFNDIVCTDQNACTQDLCIDACYCENTPLYDVQSHCCNPVNGATVSVDDNNPCTADACNAQNGQVTHTAINSGPCDDGNECTIHDACTNGTCIGATASTVACTSNADCFPAMCNPETNRCDCIDRCPNDPDKFFPGVCGCGIPDVGDGDGDGTLDCVDGCPDDPTKPAPGICGCGVPDIGDSDADGVLDCVDVCPGLDDHIFAPSCEPPIPTVSQWGVTITTLLLLAGGKLLFGSRPCARRGSSKS